MQVRGVSPYQYLSPKNPRRNDERKERHGNHSNVMIDVVPESTSVMLIMMNGREFEIYVVRLSKDSVRVLHIVQVKVVRE